MDYFLAHSAKIFFKGPQFFKRPPQMGGPWGGLSNKWGNFKSRRLSNTIGCKLQLELATIFSHINPLIIVLIDENRVETRYENVTEKK